MLRKAYFELLEKINPRILLIEFLKNEKIEDFLNAVAIGKAAIPMINSLYDFDGFEKGFAISPCEGDVPPNTELCLSTHPDITEKSFKCSNKLIDFLRQTEGRTAILLSGGGSALIEKPLDFLTLDEISKSSDFLIKSGLPIEEINFFRIHLSKIKGGGLLNYLKTPAKCFVLCDVLGKRIDRVSSAPFLYVKRDYSLFVEKADKIGLWQYIPREKRQLFLNPDFKIKENRVLHSVIADNTTVVDLFSSFLEKEGFECLKYYDFIKEDVEKEARKLVNFTFELLDKKNDAIICGGEATVKVKGKGKGGRTLELGLRLIRSFLEKGIIPQIEFLFATTDGKDGNSDCAGVYVNFENLQKIFNKETVKTIDTFLKGNDSKAFFEQYGCLLNIGYTGTNLLDVYAIKKIIEKQNGTM